MGTTKKRAEIIRKMILSIQESERSGKQVLEEKLIAFVCLEYATCRRTVREYIDLLILTDRLERKKTDEGSIITEKITNV